MEPGPIARFGPRLGITDPSILRKAEEYSRLSQVKCTGLSAHTTETSNAIMCLDLAATTMRWPLDRTYLVKLSGLNKKMYQSCLKSFECLLGLNSNVGIKDLAVQFNCVEAVNIASKILQRYEASLSQIQKVDLDLSKPLFTTATLFSACRASIKHVWKKNKCHSLDDKSVHISWVLKIKVNKDKMVATCGVKKAVFDRLCKQLEKFEQQVKGEPSSSTSPPAKRQKIIVEHSKKEIEEEAESLCKQQQSEDLKQDYEEWKRKILENAAKAQKK
ncbi:origin recognition complex subunit 6 isoform X1 [Phascolarctos cinereus]